MTNILSKNLTLSSPLNSESSLKLALKLAGGSLIGLAILYLGKIWHSYSFFSKMKIKTPKYKYLYGNLNEIMKNVSYSML